MIKPMQTEEWIRLECVKVSGGDLDKAKALEQFIRGYVDVPAQNLQPRRIPAPPPPLPETDPNGS